MPRFVLLYHRCPLEQEKPSHWDWMLEHGQALWTWQLLELPASWRVALADRVVPRMPSKISETVSIRRLPDHRLAYLDHEGPVSAGRGEVKRCDSGTYQFIRQESGLLVIDMQGTMLRCRVEVKENKLTVKAPEFRS